jgi:hypothetical protein
VQRHPLTGAKRTGEGEPVGPPAHLARRPRAERQLRSAPGEESREHLSLVSVDGSNERRVRSGRSAAQGQLASSFQKSEDQVEETQDVEPDWSGIVPAGVWHNVVNTGDGELKLYSPYSPPDHPDGTVHRTDGDTMAAERR